MSKFLHALACGWTALMMAGPAAAWTVRTFDLPGATETELWDVNDAGVIVGNSDLGGFVLDGSKVTMLPAYHGMPVTADGITQDGSVLGSAFNGSDPAQALIYANGSYTPLAFPGVAGAIARHISANGRFVSGTYDSGSLGGGFVFDLVTGKVGLVTAPGKQYLVQGVDNRGLATGSDFPTTTALTYDLATGVTTFYGVPGISRPHFRDINEAGQVVGFGNAAGAGVAFIGTPGGSFEIIPVPGATSAIGYGMNDRGVVVGISGDASTVHGFIATAVPEPAPMLLWAGGLALVAVRRYRSRS